MDTAVVEALSAAGDVDATYIFVSVVDTGVTLSGWVATTEEIARASVICAAIAGVAGVTNRLQIG
ncbi:BON domain-containing protein [Ferirhizobium litorale]|uniref:BON domain-containing protein n=1 Tax=Ferirhizobium litorale TaxID=2927786 RepID=UPI00353026DA